MEKGKRQKEKKEPLKVAIVHDWFVGWGAESVVEQIHMLYPNAPIYTSYCNDEWRQRLGGKVVTGYLQKWPFSGLRKFIPFLRGWWFARLDLSEYDLVISSSGAEAKFIRVDKKQVRNMGLAEAQGANENRKEDVRLGTATANRNSQHSDSAKSVGGVGGSAVKQTKTVHVSYIHAPTHYYWNRYDDYLKHPGFGFFDPLARLGLKILVGPMRRWDYRAAQRPDYLIANSNFTKEQIKKYYSRDASVIHPPVDTQRFRDNAPNTSKQRSGFVIAGRMTPYKRFDLAIAACNKLALPLKVIGTGPDYKKLTSIAGPTIEFTGKLNAKDIAKAFSGAKAFIFPGVDDFGIVAVEAMAAGTPVIAYKRGGANDYVSKKTGLLFEKQTINSLADALSSFDSKNFNHSDISSSAEAYSIESFKHKFKTYISECIR